MIEVIEALIQATSKDRVTTNETILAQHSKDEAYLKPRNPDVVVFPESSEEVSRIIKIANEFQVPVVPFGLGTSLEGHVIPYHGGISLDFSSMNQQIEVKPDDFLVTVDPGVTRSQLNKKLKPYGLFFSVDPGADATLGGMAATNASGTTAVKYGVMKDQVRSLEVVLPNGKIIQTGTHAAKSSSGYHLSSLFVGSEGTLGCITKLTLQVYGIPETIVAARVSFKHLNQAVEAVIQLLSAGIQLARVELVDEASIKQVNESNEKSFKEAPTLFIEFHGNEASVHHDISFAEELLADADGMDIEFEKDVKGRNELWEARHNLAYSFVHGHPGKKMMVTDVCLPISQLALGIQHAREQMDALSLEGALLGHVGDGNFHALLMIDPENAEEKRKADLFNEAIVHHALQRGGTCTGEHGVGVGKMKYQQLEHGDSFEVMQQIKMALDPNQIMNPGKIFDRV
ncbi:FAD-binding protein [Halobacillus litoralis]|uniref:D-lactate dehydrogenase (cytochrome) n=1 Tax=Halobacillus litoralis TaxID=45668 RepID=A0A845E122_9BACI|nr:FAD-linked oxidase C-terminal domain-containing protein [Halobacillus litoralis]MYL49305.1 FAD-binding protein [Halobacillus litoralis]